MSPNSILKPKESAQFIADNSKDVKILTAGVQKTAKQLYELIKTKQEILHVDRWQLHELNPKTADQKALDWVFLVDILNFSFWSDDESKKYAKKYNDTEWTGYWSLCAAINKALDSGIPLTDPKYYSTISKDDLTDILKSDSDYQMPLFEERLRILHESGKVLIEKYNGSFANVVQKANQSAQSLLQLVVQEFPSLRDTAEFEGRKVALYKRAQIIVADVWACCGGKGLGEFHDIDTITMFADYRIPQALVWFGVMEYSPALMDVLKKGSLIANGDRYEVEIRGCSIWAVELLVEDIKKLIAEDPDMSCDMNAIIVDHFMWDYRREHAEETASIPFHRTRCIYY